MSDNGYDLRDEFDLAESQYGAMSLCWEGFTTIAANIYRRAIRCNDLESLVLVARLENWADEMFLESPDLPDVLEREVKLVRHFHIQKELADEASSEWEREGWSTTRVVRHNGMRGWVYFVAHPVRPTL